MPVIRATLVLSLVLALLSPLVAADLEKGPYQGRDPDPHRVQRLGDTDQSGGGAVLTDPGETPIADWAGRPTASRPTRDVPAPLPAECGGSTDACCVYGYVYADNAPVEGAQVRLQSPAGTKTISTAPGDESAFPYYHAELSASPLYAYAGTTVTITVSYGPLEATRAWTVVDDGQQVDLGLSTSPAARRGHGWIYDAARQRFVLFGGWDGTQVLSDTWEYDGSRWLRRSTPQAPPARFDAGLAYDSDRGRVVLFGGASADGTLYADTWEYDGLNWTEIPTADAPSGRAGPAMAYDGSRGQVVLFGGTTNPGQAHPVLGDTWEYDGQYWEQPFTHTLAGRLAPHGLVYDDDAQRILLHGGWKGYDQGCDNETWEYDGNDWLLWSTSGPFRHEHSMVYDRARERVLLYGGRDCYQCRDETWEYDPRTLLWAALPLTTSPTACSAPMAYSPDDQQVLLFGGRDSAGNLLDELWAYDPTAQYWQPVTVQEVAPNADFAAFLPLSTSAPLSGTAPLEVQFVDQSAGELTSWRWEFGDGEHSGARYPAHVYRAGGSFPVTLEAAGPGGVDIEHKEAYVQVDPPLFLPPEAHIVDVQPHPATQGRDIVYFDGEAFDQDEEGCCVSGCEWTLDGVFWLSDEQDFYLAADQLPLGLHTVSFRAVDDEGELSPLRTTSLMVLEPLTGTIRTLILVNRQRLSDLYGEEQAGAVLAQLDRLAAHPQVYGQVLQVEEDPAVSEAYDAWDQVPTSTVRANTVTVAIKGLIDPYWQDNPALQHMVIVGDDRVIPFHRVPDRTHYPESNYPGVLMTTTVGAAMGDDMTLTDNYYADDIPTVLYGPRWGGHELYLPDLGTGRLVETPQEIIAQIEAFLDDPQRTVGSAVVSGYSFVEDGARAISDCLGSEGYPVDGTLIGSPWGADDWATVMLDTPHDVASFSGHGDHDQIGTPTGGVGAERVLAAGADLGGTLFYAAGCHAGLNVPPDNAGRALDLPQAFSRQRANYVANTGYGWGHVTTVGLTEQLLLNFSEQLVQGQSAYVGPALAMAKRAYFLNEPHLDGYDEKVLLESTLYGLPMARYHGPAGTVEGLAAPGMALPTEKARFVRPDGGGTIRFASPIFAFTQAETPEGSYFYTGEGRLQADHGEPIQPSSAFFAHWPGYEAHGVLFTGAAYSEVTDFNPVVERAITGTVAPPEPPFSAPDWYPLQPLRLNRLEQGAQVIFLLGQFSPGEQVERLYPQVDFELLFSNEADWTPPAVRHISSRLVEGLAYVDVRVGDPAGVEAVIVTYDDGAGHWRAVELQEAQGGWSGAFPAGSGTPFFIQAVDRAGNVALVENQGRYFRPGQGRVEVYLPMMRK